MANIDFKQIQEDLQGSKNILILAAANPSLDSIAAALSLYLIFKKMGKNVGIGCPTKMTVAFNRLVGIDKVTDNIGSRNLVISFDYVKDSIEKVSYNIEDNKFNLVIEPKSNFPPLNPDKVAYSYTGANADIVFVIGATKLEDLEKFYFDDKKIFNDKLTVNIDYRQNNTRFGKINFQDSQYTSCSEIVTAFVRDLGLPIDPDIATNLFSGIKANTSSFQAININVSAFEAAAWCLKNGARKDYFSTGFNQPFQPGPFTSSSFQAPLQQFPTSPTGNTNSQPPADWLKPKIFKGKNIT